VTAEPTKFTIEYQPPPPPVAGQFWIKNNNGPDLHLSPAELVVLYIALDATISEHADLLEPMLEL
jgi:hypothetical protein